MKFKAGDVVVIVDDFGGISPYRVGDVATIIRGWKGSGYSIEIKKEGLDSRCFSPKELLLIKNEQDRLNYKYGVK